MDFQTQQARFFYFGYEMVSLDKTRMRGQNQYMILDESKGTVVKTFKSLKESGNYLIDLCLANK